MDKKKMPATEEEFIAFIAEGMEPLGPEEPAETGSASSWAENEEGVNWHSKPVTEEEVARENGCWIDDDGHWIPMDDEYGW